MEELLRRRGPTLIVYFSLLLCFFVVLAVLGLPVVYDTRRVPDTTFLAMVGQWVQAGDLPGRDFDHFYGGLHEWFVARAMDLFGVNIKALEYALGLQVIALGALLIIVSWRRLTASSASIFFLLIVVLIFARVPLEVTPLPTRMQSAHSFAYNRLGTALSILSVIFVLVPGKDRPSEITGALVAGFSLYCALLSKSTFAPVVFAAFFGMLIQYRWTALTYTLIAFVLSAFLLDPGGDRVLGTFAYSVESAAGTGGKPWLLEKFVGLMLAQQFQLLMLLAVVFFVGRTGTKSSWRVICTAVIVLAAFWASSVTMGTHVHVGHQAAPVLATIALALTIVSAPMHKAAFALSLLLVGFFVVPHSLMAFRTAFEIANKVDHVAIREGPMSGYLVASAPLVDEEGRLVSPHQDLEGSLIAAAALMKSQGARYYPVADYLRIIDAITVTNGNAEPDTGVVSDNRIGLGFALGTRRVESFPA